MSDGDLVRSILDILEDMREKILEKDITGNVVDVNVVGEDGWQLLMKGINFLKAGSHNLAL